MTSEDAPKSAYEIAMERLRRQDREAGVEERPLSDEQRRAIAELRRLYEAKLAEAEIFHQGALKKVRTPEERDQAEEQYRRERERLQSERERKLEELRRRS